MRQYDRTGQLTSPIGQSLTAGGHVRYQLRTAYRDGTTYVLFDPLDFLARLAALVLKPRVNLSRFHGVFAPNSAHRAQVTKAGRGKGARAQAAAETDERTPADRRASMTWAQRLKRVFGIDIETCSACAGAMRITVCIEHPASITPGDREDSRSLRCESGSRSGLPAAAVSGAARADVRLRRAPPGFARLLRSTRGLGGAALKGRHRPHRGDGEPGLQGERR